MFIIKYDGDRAGSVWRVSSVAFLLQLCCREGDKHFYDAQEYKQHNA
jgi:hypothetical protein